MNNLIKKIPRDNHFKKYLLALVILSLLLSILIVPVELGNKINDIGDGLWWAITTVTGVGYGDLVPVTGLGRAIGAVLMTVGLVLFSLIVAILSGQIMKKEEKYWRLRMKKDLESINNKLYRLEEKIEFLIKEKTRLG
ncbi:MAG: potassium channel family protein [Candidatus Beckwithbacteria bacterium]